MAAAAILKNKKSQYICNGTTKFDEIWRNDATTFSGHRQFIKFSQIRKSKIAATTIFKNQKIAIFP